MTSTLSELKRTGEAPQWLTEFALFKMQTAYLLPGETPRGMWTRVAKASANRLGKPELAERFFDLFFRGFLGGATPVLSNMGSARGLPISCFSIHVGDTTNQIWKKAHELAMLSKHGGGVGVYVGDLRAAGTPISTGGTSRGPYSFAKLFDTSTEVVSQGNVRRGASALYLPITHGDAKDFMNIRRRETPHNRRLDTAHAAFSIPDHFMQSVQAGDPEAFALWTDLLKTRFEEGEHFMFFSDSVREARPQMYKDLGLEVTTSNICSEILLHTDPDHSFVCCLSSMNLARWDEWQDTDAVYWATWFLEGVMQEFLDKAKNLEGFENAVRFAQKGRPIGLGVMGFHTLLQSKMIPLNSFSARMLSKAFAKRLHDETLRASQDMAKELGEPEWCKGYGVRHTHRTAIAPTESNSELAGEVSPGIEPVLANVFTKAGAQGNRPKYNQTLKAHLATLGQDTEKVWKVVLSDEGSVRSLPFLSPEEKAVFATAYEVDQKVLVDLAADRNPFICQGQSLNLFFSKTVEPQYFHDVHWRAWERKIRTLYYCRSETNLRPTLSNSEECEACHG